MGCRSADEFFTPDVVKDESPKRNYKVSYHPLVNNGLHVTGTFEYQRQRDQAWEETVEAILDWVAGAIHGDTQSLRLIDFLLEELSELVPSNTSCISLKDSQRFYCSSSPVRLQCGMEERCDTDIGSSCTHDAACIERDLYHLDVTFTSSCRSCSLNATVVEVDAEWGDTLGDQTVTIRSRDAESLLGGSECCWRGPAFVFDEEISFIKSNNEKGFDWNNGNGEYLVQDSDCDALLSGVASMERTGSWDYIKPDGSRFKVLDSDDGREDEEKKKQCQWCGAPASDRLLRMRSNDRWPFL